MRAWIVYSGMRSRDMFPLYFSAASHFSRHLRGVYQRHTECARGSCTAACAHVICFLSCSVYIIYGISLYDNYNEYRAKARARGRGLGLAL